MRRFISWFKRFFLNIKTKYTINVTEEDILRCTPENPSKCMVALALKRATKAKYISVGISDFTLGVSLDRIPLPQEVEKQIRNRLSGLPVTPFSFEIYV